MGEFIKMPKMLGFLKNCFDCESGIRGHPSHACICSSTRTKVAKLSYFCCEDEEIARMERKKLIKDQNKNLDDESDSDDPSDSDSDDD